MMRLGKGFGRHGVIAIDTNIIVRFLTRDNESQYQKTIALFNTEELFVADTAILETEWVLRFAYNLSPPEIVQAFRKLLGLANVHVKDELILARIIDWYEQGVDFADSFHLANSEHLAELVTFDEKFCKRAKNRSGCRVRRP